MEPRACDDGKQQRAGWLSRQGRFVILVDLEGEALLKGIDCLCRRVVFDIKVHFYRKYAPF